MPHILVSQEEHYGKNVWVHRNGTTRAYGPSRMQDHPTFKETGEPAFIPTSMSTEAYLCVGQDGNDSSFYSCNHGAGKSAKNIRMSYPESKEALHEKLATRGVKLYNGRSSKVIEQDSSHYKRAEDVIESVVENNIVKPVVKTCSPSQSSCTNVMRFITLSGVDGSGKSTQLELLRTKLGTRWQKGRVFPCRGVFVGQ
jgi:RNA-splicing ligase RtcB